MSLAAGTRLGPYEILGLIGSGGMGEVYKATDTRLDRTVAVKILPSDIARDPDRRARFEREAKTVAGLMHPHICTLHDVGEHAGSMFLVMEHLDGETLAHRLEKGPLSTEEVLTIGTEIAEALAAAHRQGIIHHDLKPGNVMLTQAGAKLLDFGLAQPAVQQDLQSDDSTCAAMPFAVAGTVPYMSPEQALGKTLDHRSDLFSLGVVLYEMATGRLPFSASTPYELIDNVIHGDPAPIRSVNPEIPPGLERVILGCLEKRTEQRIQTAAELLRDLRRSAAEPQSPGQDQHVNDNLPQQLTRFIGRRKELAEIRNAVKRTRLLTLSGPGGIGKTRLALQAAAELRHEYADGVWFVEFASLVDPRLVPNAVASTLGLREEGGRSITDTLLNYLKEKHVLLILDNCEHLIAACARLADALLRGAPNLRIVATSRESLTIAGESVFRVISLSLPDPDRLSEVASVARHESVELFADRARSVKSTFAVSQSNAAIVAKLCVQLDGIPLAIELAASRMRALSIQQIAARLDDRFGLLTGGSRAALPRHQTLLAAIDWSYNLLPESEKLLFRRLSVFRGGWTLEAAEIVCAGNGVDRRSVLELMAGLVDKSLVVAEERDGRQRYRFMATMLEYALNHLMQSSEEEAITRAHTNFCLALALDVESKLETREQKAGLEQLHAEHDNIRAALKWTLKHDSGQGLRLAGALRRFWYLRGYSAEGRRWLEQMLATPDGLADSAQRVKALNGAALLAENQSDLAAARSFAEEALTLCQQSNDTRETAVALSCLGIVAGRQSEFAMARSYLEEALAIWRDLGDKGWTAITLNNAGILALLQGECASARSLFEESVTISRQADDKHRIATALLNRGEVARRMGDHAGAQSLVEEGFRLAKELGDRSLIPIALHSLGDLASRQGDYAAAQAFLTEGLNGSRDSGDRRLTMDLLVSLGLVTEACVVAQSRFEESLAIAREVGDKRGIAAALTCLGNLAVRQGDCVAARTLLEESHAIWQMLRAKDGTARSISGLADLARFEADNTLALSRYKQSLTAWSELGEKPELPQLLERIASLAKGRGEHDCAVRLWGAAQALRSSLSVPRPAFESEEFQRDLDAAHEALGEAAFAAAWAGGQATDTDRAVAMALELT